MIASVSAVSPSQNHPENEPSRWLFAVTLGPVQDFIAAARRTRDLWFGSWLLSDLSRTIALAIAQAHRPQLDEDAALQTLIFPAPKDWDELENADFQITNKILALSHLEPSALAKTCRAAMEARLEALWKEARGDIKGQLATAGIAWEQILDLPEFYVAACPLADDAEYFETRRRVERLLAERKNTRDFRAATWASAVVKSSLDGQRESVIPEEAYPQIQVGEKAEDRRARFAKVHWALRQNYGLRHSERLCGVGLLKRHGKSLRAEAGAKFAAASTSHMAAMPLLRRWQEEYGGDGGVARKKILDYAHGMTAIADDDLGFAPHAPAIFKRDDKPFFFDGHLIFEERLNDFFDAPADAKDAQEALQELLKNLTPGDETTWRPNPYYVLLHGDGDRMGETIDRLKTPDAHRNFSLQLSGFAAAAKTIVAECDGSLVYAGGDDVLALLPLHTALLAALRLQQAFKAALSDFTEEGKSDSSPTLSAGLVIAHHLDALEDSLQLAREAEKIAKRVPGKNALAITLARRGGSPRTAAGQKGRFDKRLRTMIGWHLEGKIAHGLPYEWLELEKRLSPHSGGAHQSDLRELLWLEATRILERKRDTRGQERIDEETIAETLRDWLDQLKASSGENVGALETLAHELIVASVLTDAMQQAYGEDAEYELLEVEAMSL